MWVFNGEKISLFFKSLMGLTVLVAMNACQVSKDPVSDDKLYRDNPNATFYVERIQGAVTTLKTKQMKDWAIPEARVLSLKACLKDIGRREKVLGQTFRVKGERGDQDVKTDSEGCINWSETIHFNYLANQYILTLDRKITALGSHRGSVTIPFGVNMWEDQPKVLDLRKDDLSLLADTQVVKSENVIQALRGNLNGKRDRARIWLETLRVTISVTGFKGDFKGEKEYSMVDILLGGKPEVLIQDHTGRTIKKKLEIGELELTPYLLRVDEESGVADKKLLHEKTGIIKAPLKNGTFAARFQVKIPLIPTTGQVQLGIRIRPKNGPPGLEGFDGVYLLKQSNRMLGNHYGILLPEVITNENFRVDEYLPKEASHFSYGLNKREGQKYWDKDAQHPGFIRAKYKMGEFRLQFDGLQPTKDYTTWQTRFIGVKACLVNPFDNWPIKNRRIRVRKFVRPAGDKEPANETGEKVEWDNNNRPVVYRFTDPWGCIKWADALTFLRYDTQHRQVRTVILEDPKNGFHQEIPIAVNPWGDGWTYGRDARYMDDELINQGSKIKPRIRIFNYDTRVLGWKYEINDLFEMKVKKQFRIELDARIINHGDITHGRQGNDSLTDGWWYARIVLKTNGVENKNRLNQYVSHWEGLAFADGGRLVFDIGLSFEELYLLGSRNDFLVEILPVNELKIARQNGRPGDRFSSPLAKKLTYDQKGNLINDKINIHYKSGLITGVFKAPFSPISQTEDSKMAYVDNANPEIQQVKHPTLRDFLWKSVKAKRALNKRKFSKYSQTSFENTFRLKRIDLSNGKQIASFAQKTGFSAKEIDSIVRNYYGQYLDPKDKENKKTRLYKFAQMMCEYFFQETPPLTEKILKNVTYRNGWDRKYNPPMTGEEDEKEAKLTFAERRQLQKMRRRGARIYGQDIPIPLVREYSKCIRDPFEYLDFDKKIHVIPRMSSDGVISLLKEELIGGQSHNQNVGLSINKSKEQSRSVSTSKGTSFSVSQGLGIFKSIFGIDTKVSASIDGKVGTSRGEGTSISVSSNSSTALVVEKSDFWITINEYQECLVVKPDFNILSKGLNFIIKDMSYKEKVELLDKGFHICLNGVTKKPRTVLESYYFLSQHFTGPYSVIQDIPDVRNRPWLWGIRGRRDFALLADKFNHNKSVDEVNRNPESPHQTLNDLKAYSKKLPSYPTVYTDYGLDRTDNDSSNPNILYRDKENLWDKWIDFVMPDMKGYLKN